MIQELKLTAVFTLPEDTREKARAIVDAGEALDRLRSEFPSAAFTFGVVTLKPRFTRAAASDEA